MAKDTPGAGQGPKGALSSEKQAAKLSAEVKKSQRKAGATTPVKVVALADHFDGTRLFKEGEHHIHHLKKGEELPPHLVTEKDYEKLAAEDTDVEEVDED